MILVRTADSCLAADESMEEALIFPRDIEQDIRQKRA